MRCRQRNAEAVDSDNDAEAAARASMRRPALCTLPPTHGHNHTGAIMHEWHGHPSGSHAQTCRPVVRHAPRARPWSTPWCAAQDRAPAGRAPHPGTPRTRTACGAVPAVCPVPWSSTRRRRWRARACALADSVLRHCVCLPGRRRSGGGTTLQVRGRTAYGGPPGACGATTPLARGERQALGLATAVAWRQATQARWHVHRPQSCETSQGAHPARTGTPDLSHHRCDCTLSS